MKLAFNGATTMKADLLTDIRAASLAGFDLLEIWAAKLRRFLENGTTADLKRSFEENKIRPYSINSIEHIAFRDEEKHAQLLSECEEHCRIASEIECPYVVVVPSPLPVSVSREENVKENVRVLQELSGIAEGYNVALAFEFLGQTRCSVQTLELANEIITRVARENVGLVIDTFHFYAGGSKLESIEELDAERLYILHINDAEDLPRGELEDRHRLMPGQGILPLDETIGALKRAGYDRVASVEIFRPAYWKRDPFEIAREAHANATDVIGRHYGKN